MSQTKQQSQHNTPIYLLWDESYFWGVMFWRALRALNIDFSTCRSRDIARGLLQDSPHRGLIVPGGFASSKARSLGRAGRSAILDFVKNRGKYIGFCGGAGLALNSDPGLGLSSWKRKPASRRLPNCSGHIKVYPETDSRYLPQNMDFPVSVPIWWPSQFEAVNNTSTRILATYGEPEQDFWVGDLDLSYLDKELISSWEKVYQINLDPDLLKNEPAVTWGRFGQGSFLLSYMHLETPNSPAANCWLQGILAEMSITQSNLVPEWDLMNIQILWKDSQLNRAREILQELIHSGKENFLLCHRKPWLLGWRRGIPGFALNTLLAMLSQIQELPPGRSALRFWDTNQDSFMELLQRYRLLFQRYLIRKRLELASDPRYASGSYELDPIKKQLSGNAQDNLFGGLLGILQEMLWLQISQYESCLSC